MAILGSDNNIGITVDTKANTRGIDDTASSIDGLSLKTVALGSTIGNLAATGITKLLSGLKQMGVSAIESSGSFEQSRIAFETMLGSADKARGLMGEIAKFAKETPFELPEVVAGTKQLLAFGIAQEDLLPTMRRLGDVASGVSVPVGQIAYAYGQVKVAGKLMATELLQFTNAGVPLLEELAKVMKKPQNEIRKLIEDGKVGFPEVEQAFKNMTSEGGKFSNLMEKQSQSFNGVVSNIKDGFGQVLRSAVGVTNQGDIIKGGFFDKVKDGAQEMLKVMGTIDYDKLTLATSGLMDATINLAKSIIDLGKQAWGYLGPKVEELWKTVQSDLIPVMERLWKDVIVPLAPVIGELLVGALGLAIDAARFLIDGISGIIDEIMNGNPILWGLIGTLGVLGGAMALSAGVSAFSGAVSTMVIAWGGLTALIASPIVMPALVIGAAIGAIAAVTSAYINMRNEIEATKRSQEGLMKSSKDAIERSYATLNNGVSSPEAKASAQRLLDAIRRGDYSGRASGGSVKANTPYLVGENADGTPNATSELFIPNQSGTILNARDTQRLLSGGGSGLNVVQNIYSQVDYNKGIAKLGFMLRT